MAYKRKPLIKPLIKRLLKKRVNRQAGRKNFASRVKKAISTMVEKKIVRFNGDTIFGSYNTTNWASNALILLTPSSGVNVNIAQGVSQAARIGNKITVNRYVFDGILNPSQQQSIVNPFPKPQDVMIVIFQSKVDPTALLASLPNFLQSGSSSIAPTGSQFDSLVPINTDVYRVMYKRMFKLGTADFAVAGTTAAAQYYANNDYKYCQRFRIDCTKYLPKHIKYNDGAGVPSCNNTWLGIFPMPANGSTPGTAENATLGFRYNWTMTYTDM